jgi:hypothetical protein
MSTQVTLGLPGETYQRVAEYAAYAHRDLSEVIATALASTLPSSEAIQQLQGIANLPDQEILALTELRLEPETDCRLSELLDHQQAGTISDAERVELATLMRKYEIGVLRQSQALAEVVSRGLLPPLQQ